LVLGDRILLNSWPNTVASDFTLATRHMKRVENEQVTLVTLITTMN